jgi:hypothetical protein
MAAEKVSMVSLAVSGGQWPGANGNTEFSMGQYRKWVGWRIGGQAQSTVYG